MPRGKTAGKTPGKPALQVIVSEALCQQKHPSAEDPLPFPRISMADDTQGVTMDRILQEISPVSRKLEGMDSAMVALTAVSRSMRLDIAGFQSQISGLDQRVATMEMQGAQTGSQETKRKRPPRPIIICLLRHMQARQLLQAARMQGAFRSGTLEIRLSADFSKETTNKGKPSYPFVLASVT
ncbi:hypothetical protein NDU88_001444 [Pleurodeles waltl]|uniref:Uncharacterized protein n=1 Tax=Pleurodeles waltl TaxID=8319 RepID=A0AAV7V896_PLEWA|nr:hypothetical protein NDU88_001444 [Pleurodeles waltl]